MSAAVAVLTESGALTAAGRAMVDALGADTSANRRVLVVASEYTGRWIGTGSGAPETVLQEAVIRMAAHLRGSASGLGMRRLEVGDIAIEGGNPAASFRASGAMALLSPWKSRGAG